LKRKFDELDSSPSPVTQRPLPDLNSRQQWEHIEVGMAQVRDNGKCNPTSIPFDSIPFYLSVRLRHSCSRKNS
jgi:hypothetical protein